MIKYILCLGLFWSQAVFSGALFYNGELSPKPQKVLSDWKFYNIDLQAVEIKADPKDHRAITLAKELLVERFEAINAQDHNTSKAQKAVIYLGTAGMELIDEACRNSEINFDEQFILPQGYIIRVIDGDSELKIIACGTDHRGAFNAAMTILQMTGIEDLQTGIKLADIDDWADWSGRYAAEFHRVPSNEQLIDMLKFKINAYAIQHRYEWRNFTEETYKTSMPAFTKFNEDYELMDYMLVLHLYSAWPRILPLMDISKEEDVLQLIDVCRYAAESGIKHIMICVDDWTPNDGIRYVCIHQSERDMFDDSVAKAQGYLMTRLYTELKKSYADLEFSIIPCVYSLNEHYLMERAENFKYLRELSESMPKDIAIGWTGAEIIHDRVERDDFLKYSRAVGGRRLIYWDNTEGVNRPITHWNTRFYDGFELDSGGTLFQNVRMYRLEWGRSFVVNTNDYLWNSKEFDNWQSHKNAVEKLYGVGKFEPVREFIEKQRLVKELDDCEQRLAVLEELDGLIKQMQEYQLPAIEESINFVKLKRQECEVDLPQVSVPLLEQEPTLDGNLDEPVWQQAAILNFRHNSGSDEKIYPVQGRIFYTDNAVYIGFEVSYDGDLPDPGYARKRDDTVYSSNDAVEMFFKTDGEDQYSHLVFDHAENIFDEWSSLKNQHLWNPDWEIKTQKTDSRWVAEIRVSYFCFGEESEVKPVKGSVWNANFIRVFNAKGHISAWSPTHSHTNFHNNSFWGSLIFE